LGISIVFISALDEQAQYQKHTDHYDQTMGHERSPDNTVCTILPWGFRESAAASGRVLSDVGPIAGNLPKAEHLVA
jgi:hypothetical protein